MPQARFLMHVPETQLGCKGARDVTPSCYRWMCLGAFLLRISRS